MTTENLDLKKAGVDEETARKAAQAVVAAEDREQLASKADLAELRIIMEARLGRIEADLAWTKWIIAGTNGKLTVLIALNVAMVLAAIGPYLARVFL